MKRNNEKEKVQKYEPKIADAANLPRPTVPSGLQLKVLFLPSMKIGIYFCRTNSNLRQQLLRGPVTNRCKKRTERPHTAGGGRVSCFRRRATWKEPTTLSAMGDEGWSVEGRRGLRSCGNTKGPCISAGDEEGLGASLVGDDVAVLSAAG